MKVEIVTPIKLSTRQGEIYAAQVTESELNQTAAQVTYMGGGSFGKAYCVELGNGQSIVIKFLLAPHMIDKEVFDLQLLADNCTAKMPRVLFKRMADASIPVDCYGMEKIEGKPVFLCWKMWLSGKKKKKAFATNVTEHLHRIHQVTCDKFGDTMHPIYDTWQDCYKPFAQEVLLFAEKFYAEGKLAKRIIRVMRKAWEKFDLIFSEKVEKAVLIHGDLNIGNIMADTKGNLVGFIDPLHSMYADVEYDLFQFDNFGKCFMLRDTYIEKYGASKYYREKLAFYGLWNEVYCYMKSGVYVSIIMNPLVRNMKKILRKL